MRSLTWAFLLTLTSTHVAMAQQGDGVDSITIDGIKYAIYSETGNASVCGYADDLANAQIRESLTFDGRDYAVTHINDYAFQDSKTLAKVVIPNSIVSMGEGVFSKCTSLTDATIGTGITELPKKTFYNCSILPTITIPANVTVIGNNTFTYCYKLNTVVIEDRDEVLDIGYFSLGNGFPMFGNSALDSVYVGGSTTFKVSPFQKNTGLRVVKFGGNSTEVADEEFKFCSNLQTVDLGNSVTKIGASAFSGCEILTTLTLGTGMEAIGETAFAGCDNVTKLECLAQVPPTCANGALNDIDKTQCTLYVPASSMSAYQSADQWKDFTLVEAIEGVASSIVEAFSHSSDSQTVFYDLNGRPVNHTAHGVFIKVANGKTCKVVH